jgi:hypothetical protein
LAGRVDGVFEVRDALDNIFKSNQISNFIPGAGEEDYVVFDP